jgi:uncharacterized SAM-binding protein YcdF (DUF218 family)
MNVSPLLYCRMSSILTRTGLLRHRTLPVPTWKGWLLVAILLCVAVLFLPGALYTSLAVSDPVGDGLLVIEGWVPDQTVQQGVDLLRSGRYGHIVTTGVPIEVGFYLSKYGTTAEAAAATCLQLGLDSSMVSAAPARGHILRDRTYASAYALRRWITRSAPGVRHLDIITQGVHARRTHMIFARVLGDSIRVGIIAAPETRYGPGDWWSSSAGVKDVLGEVAGFIYATFARDEAPPEE